MRFVLFVEGETERKSLPAFLKRWLDSAGLREPVGLQPVRFDGWSDMVRDAPLKAHMHLQEPDVIAVIGLLDLYGPAIYPDNRDSADERYDWAKRHIETQVGHSRFRQFFAVHETEAWLLSQPELFKDEIVQSIARKAPNPETVDFEEPPARLLRRLYRQRTGYEYKKVADGSRLFQKLDVEIARSRCPHLRAMLDELLALARAAQSGRAR